MRLAQKGHDVRTVTENEPVKGESSELTVVSSPSNLNKTQTNPAEVVFLLQTRVRCLSQ